MNEQKQILISTYLETPLGTMLALADEEHLYLLKFLNDKNVDISMNKVQQVTTCTIEQGSNKLLETLQKEVKNYFNGSLKNFTTPLKLIGTQFQIKCWQALQTIPYGATTSYGAQACIINSPLACRAVGSANGHNIIAIIIPCHRIINMNGKLGGYASGLHRKTALLELEKNSQINQNKSQSRN